MRESTSAVGLAGSRARAHSGLTSGHVAAGDVSSIIVHGLRLGGWLVETGARKARRCGCWYVSKRVTSIVASKVIRDRVSAVCKLWTRWCVESRIASRRHARIGWHIISIRWSERHGEPSSLARWLVELTRTGRWDTIRHGMIRH